MPFTTLKNFMTVRFRDVRDNERTRIIELGGLVVLTDDDANRLHGVSKSAVVQYVQNNVQRDDALAPDADSEVRDTLRLYFRLPSQETAHFDVPDPKDALFLSATGPGANIAIDKSDMDAAVEDTPEDLLGDIIDSILAGEILISDGEQPEAYLYGERVTWR